jgi:hypothetical protein
MTLVFDGQRGAPAADMARGHVEELRRQAQTLRRQAAKARELLALVRRKPSAAILASLAGELEEAALRLETLAGDKMS